VIVAFEFIAGHNSQMQRHLAMAQRSSSAKTCPLLPRYSTMGSPAKRRPSVRPTLSSSDQATVPVIRMRGLRDADRMRWASFAMRIVTRFELSSAIGPRGNDRRYRVARRCALRSRAEPWTRDSTAAWPCGQAKLAPPPAGAQAHPRRPLKRIIEAGERGKVPRCRSQYRRIRPQRAARYRETPRQRRDAAGPGEGSGIRKYATDIDERRQFHVDMGEMALKEATSDAARRLVEKESRS